MPAPETSSESPISARDRKTRPSRPRLFARMSVGVAAVMLASGAAVSAASGTVAASSAPAVVQAPAGIGTACCGSGPEPS